MPISQVALSNTFNEFRSTFNDAANTLNSAVNTLNYLDITISTGTLTVNTSASITGTTESTSTTTGSLKTAGGLGVVKNVYVGGIVDVANTTQSTSNTTGALIVDGGAGIAKNLYVGGILDVTDTTQSSNATSGALIVDGGAGIAKNLYVGGIIDVIDTTQSTSVSSGALIVDGGAGIAKNLYVGGIVDVTDTTQSSNTTSGALIVDGGVGVAKNMYVGGDMQITGNLTILGSNTSLSTTQIVIEDNILQLSHLNPADVTDIGFVGGYNNGANVHSGLFRDASDGTWKFFKDYDIEPGTTINISGNGFAFANVQAGNVTATKFFGDGSGLSGVATSGGGSTITNDTTTNASYYVGMANTTSGTQSNTFISTSKLFFNPSTGTLNATNFNSLSDETSKSNVTPIVNATDVIRALDGVEFDWVETGQKSSGVIAQRIETILPHLVTTNEFGVKSVNYQGITAYLIEAFKEIDTRLQNLEKK